MLSNNSNGFPVSISILISFLMLLTTGCKDENDEDNLQFLAEVETVGSSEVGNSSATCYGLVGSDKGFTVTERGFCFSTGITPTISDAHVACGAGSGNFEGEIINLIGSTRYYVRAYATNAKGTSYGSSISFITEAPSTPVMKVFYAQPVTGNTASVRMLVTAASGNIVSEYGICYGLNEDPKIDGPHIGKNDEIHNAIFTMTNLEEGNDYYISGYVKVPDGSVYYSDHVLFENIVGVEMITDIEGNEYITKRLNGKQWMFEDLMTKHLNDGTEIIKKTEYEWPNDGLAYYSYENFYKDNTICYNYNVVSSRKVCPEGWHVSTTDEWRDLYDYVYGNPGLLMIMGFSAKPNSLIDSYGAVSSFDSTALLMQYFWTADDVSAMFIYYNDDQWEEVFDFDPTVNEQCGIPIRCVKD